MTSEKRHLIARYTIAAIILLLFAYMFTPFFMAILLAVLFAFALENHVKRFSKRNIKRPWLSLGILAALFLLIVVPVGLVIVKAVSTVKKYADVGLQTTPLYMASEKIVHQITEQVTALAQKFDFDLTQLPQPTSYLNNVAGLVGAGATAFISALPDIALNVFVFALMLYFLLTESNSVKKTFLKLDLLAPDQLNQIIETTKKSSYTALIASAIIGCIQAGLLSTVAYFFGYTEFMVLFVITFIFSLIPVIGAAPVCIFLAIISFIQDSSGAAIGLLITSAVVGTVDNLIKPLIVNSNEETHPIIALMSLIGAIIVFGAPGILIGPVLTDLAFKIGPICFPSKEV